MHHSLKMWLVVGVLLLSAMVSALAEDVTVTTYYPSPRGVYQELRTTDHIGTSARAPGFGRSAKGIACSREQADELFNGNGRVADQAAQEAWVEHLMVWHRQGGTLTGFHQNDVAGRLASNHPASALERSHSLSPRAIPGQLGHHTAILTTFSSGWRWVVRSARSLSTARQPNIASLMFASVSCFVRPWDTHPGIAGHSATYPRTSPRRSTTLYTMGLSFRREYTGPSQRGQGEHREAKGHNQWANS